MSKGLQLALICSGALLISCAHKNQEPTTTETTTPTVQTAEPVAPMVAESEPLKTDGSDLAYTCLVAGDKRIVKMDKNQKRCEVHYTKAGETQKVAWGEARPEICDNTFTQIRNNIESRGFKCHTGLEVQSEERSTAASN